MSNDLDFENYPLGTQRPLEAQEPIPGDFDGGINTIVFPLYRKDPFRFDFVSVNIRLQNRGVGPPQEVFRSPLPVRKEPTKNPSLRNTVPVYSVRYSPL